MFLCGGLIGNEIDYMKLFSQIIQTNPDNQSLHADPKILYIISYK